MRTIMLTSTIFLFPFVLVALFLSFENSVALHCHSSWEHGNKT